jgi:DNA-binding SARP family transcriptional activator/tetratricopeptide (TPR) repeat protein
LGPVDLRVNGRPRAVPGLRAKAVLAALALTPGEIVSVDRLVAAVWGDDVGRGTMALQSQVSRLRRLLGEEGAIVARHPGYVLEVDPDATDLAVAQRLVRQARETGNVREREALLRQAASLWRGRPLAELANIAWFDDHARGLDQMLVQIRLALADAGLAQGEPASVIADLEDLAVEHPLDEQIHRRLMLALHGAGHAAEALAVYDRLRHSLADELGIDPTPPLRDLAEMIQAQRSGSGPAHPRPAQLPLAIDGFSGRGAELEVLDRLLSDGSMPVAPAVVITAISGTAGVGKTALALHWAHRVAHHFPDGQLFVDLRGYGPDAPPLDASSALHGFLAALGVPDERIPSDVDTKAGLYRSLLSGKRVLVVLDNARDVQQVRPLLPGAPGCLAVVTSRSGPEALLAAEGARPLSLDLLSIADARDLLVRRVGRLRTAAEPHAVDEIIARCARLPLALVIAAGRAATHPDLPLAAVAAALREAMLDVLHETGPATDLRGVFAWSYRSLRPEAATLFRRLALHPGPDVTVSSAASLLGSPLPRARVVLAGLTRASLLTEHTPGRYRAHDLLRAYATELTHDLDADDERHHALHRLLEHYLHSAEAAARRLNPNREANAGAPATGAIVEHFADHDQAMAWFTAEHRALVGAVTQAAAAGFDSHAWQIASALRTFLLRRGHWTDLIESQHTALTCARRLGDGSAEGDILRGLGRVYLRLVRLDDAESHYRRAEEAFAAVGDLIGQGDACTGLAEVAEMRGNQGESMRHNRRALDLYRVAGDRAGQAYALNDVGWSHALLGEYGSALTYCTEALAVLEELGNHDGAAGTLDSLGYAHRGLGHYDEAIDCYQRAVDIYRTVGDRYNEADALHSLGDTHVAAGRHDAAHSVWQHAYEILTDLGHPDADAIRSKLDGGGAPPS